MPGIQTWIARIQRKKLRRYKKLQAKWASSSYSVRHHDLPLILVLGHVTCLSLTCRANVLQLLPVVVLCFHLLPRQTLCDNLHCYYSPILEKDIPFELIEVQCPRDELCFKGDGRYGNHSILTARGCIMEADCSQVLKLRIRGVPYNMTFHCCYRAYCNSSSRLSANHIYAPMVTFFFIAVMVGALWPWLVSVLLLMGIITTYISKS